MESACPTSVKTRVGFTGTHIKHVFVIPVLLQWDRRQRERFKGQQGRFTGS